MGTREEILDYVRSNGPSTYAEIASRLGIDSIFVSAVLEDAWRNDELLRTKRFRSGRIYYTENQQGKVREKIWNRLRPKEKKIIQKLINQKILVENELEPDQTRILDKFSPFFDSFKARIGEEIYRCWKYYSVSTEEAKRLLKSKVIKKPRKKLEEPKRAKEKKAKGEENFREIIKSWFGRIGAEIEDEKTIRKNEICWLVSIPVPFGKQTYFVKAKNYKKRGVNEKDLSLAYAKGIDKKVPVIYISSTGFSQKALDFWEEHYKGFVNLMKLEDVKKS